MLLHVVYSRFVITCFLFAICRGANFVAASQDQTSMRANTLLDDADDIQRQLDNEARDRIKYGRPKTIWVFHLPTQFPEISGVLNGTRSVRETKLFRRKQKSRRRKQYSHTTKIRVKSTKDWNYRDQHLWAESYPECGGRSQSPVDMPYNGLIKARGARKLLHVNYDVKPESMKLSNDGRQVVLTAKWPKDKHPFIYGGAAHSRRYIFHSLTLHWPSEHTVAGLQYPMESQALYLAAEYHTMEKALDASASDPLAFLAVSSLYKASELHFLSLTLHWPSEHTVAGLQYPMESQALYLAAEYHTMEKALDASASDPLAFLAVSSLYKYGNRTDDGLFDIMKVAVENIGSDAAMDPKPLTHFCPPLPEYACYQGSLTAPPCTESVLWLIRGRTLPVTREIVDTAGKLLGSSNNHVHFSRSVQPMNDRKAYYFKNSCPKEHKPTHLT